ncbi:butyrophilin subfamily 1 member A1-like [Cyrtonyx montezumae]|uniref:butyrophilin subfamily 1 member A1-like n=1 Tax=Cyrtonyx montezumae TaxID=9017 RepID=UPI0032DB4F47
MTLLKDIFSICSRQKIRVLMFLSLPACFFIATWFTDEVPVTITVDPSVVSVGEQVTLTCQLAPSIPSNTSVFWYKEEKGRDAPLCSSSSLDGVVEQCQDGEKCRIKGRWERRRLLLIIQQVQIADGGVYVCVVSGNTVSQEAVTHLDVIAIGNKPALVKDQQEESLCRYTCNSKGWYPKPQVIWTTYGGGKKNMEIKSSVTWSEADLFVVKSIMTVPCDDVDVKCIVTLTKEKINQTGSLNEMIVQKPSTAHTCTYRSRIRGDYVNPKVILAISEVQGLYSLAKTSILEEKDNNFAIEFSLEMLCGQPPPSGLTANWETYLHFAQQSGNHDWVWILYLFCFIIVIGIVLQIFNSIIWHPFSDTEELRAKNESLEKENDELRAKNESLEKENEELRAKNAQLQKQIEELRTECVSVFQTSERKRPLVIEYLRNYLVIAVNVTLDADTAHPRLEVSEDGKSVTDTGVIRKVPSKEERFDSHTFLLAKEGYTSGMYYWEVDVGKKRNWNLGVAQETVTRKETVALSPKNGFWVIGLADGQEYWAHTDPWTRLTVSGRPQKIGIFLDISANKLSFFSVHQKKMLYTFTFVNHHSQNVKLFPFFSSGSSATKSDTEPLRIPLDLDDK